MTDLPKSPREAYQQGYNEGRKEAEKTLRDEIAMRAMQGLISHYGVTYVDAHPGEAYQIADAMLKVRQGDE